ncbi:MAG: DUF4404 family protein [Chloroflexi bacterium]|nr:DUF4404 family protein [Chloroflexota bacterium]
MDNPNLNDMLSKLHNELNQTEPTEKTQAVVTDLKSQLQPILAEPDADHSPHYQTLGERLNLALVDLDVDHPRLSAAIRTVLDELAAVGI